MNKQFIAKHWYASVYEQYENHTNDVEFLLKVLKEQLNGEPQNILEAACGGGRISVPLAKAGHTVTGFDADEHMLLNCYRRMRGLANITCYHADGADSDWGKDFDVVVLAGNILINIESDMDYAEAQRAFIQNAANALKPGGHVYLDFDLHSNPEKFFNSLKENSYFTGTDDLGTSGRTMGYGGVYDPVTRICAWPNHWELTMNNGEQLIVSKVGHKHIPSQEQVYQWLADAGLVIEKTYKNYTGEPIDEPVMEYVKAIIWARKV